MGTWKLGYPNGLDAAADYDAGKALYDPFGVIAITLDSTKMCRSVGQVNGAPTTTLIANNIINYPNVAVPQGVERARCNRTQSRFRVFQFSALWAAVSRVYRSRETTKSISSTIGLRQCAFSRSLSALSHNRNVPAIEGGNNSGRKSPEEERPGAKRLRARGRCRVSGVRYGPSRTSRNGLKRLATWPASSCGPTWGPIPPYPPEKTGRRTRRMA